MENWSDIAKYYAGGSLILGNGASISVCDKFSYNSLFKQAQDEGFITEPVRDIFEKLESQDFELILNNLAITKYICEKLGINFSTHDISRLNDSYNEVRAALVKTVQKVHPEYQDVAAELPKIATFMKSFRTVVSLNYDLLVYWATFRGMDEHNHEFKDCFNKGYFEQDFEQWRNPYNSRLTKEDVTLVFYPHGNLVLSYGVPDGEEIKIADTREHLLSTILSKWENFQNTPLFVSEGENERKIASIKRSNYLSSVYNRVLTSLEKRIVIFGWSMSNQDKHLLKAIAKSTPERIAISVYDEANIPMFDRIIKTQVGDIKVDFFSSNDSKCWVND